MKKYTYVVIAILVFLTSLQLWVTKDRTGQKDAIEAIAKPEEPPIGGTFALTAQDGTIVHNSDFRGRAMLVSFGFTRCPDICPVTVSTLSQTLELLGADANQLAAVFISVDPAHDTPAVMKDFLSNLDKHIVGLTGTEGQIKQVADVYKVYYAAAPKEAGAGDSIDHSGYIYLMNKDGKFLRVFPYNVPPQELANEIQTILK